MNVQDHPLRNCPVCGSVRPQVLFEQRFAAMSEGSLHEGYDVTICRACGCAYADRIPDQAAFNRHYREMSKYEDQAEGSRQTQYDLDRFAGIADRLADLIPKRDPQVLDIGCSTGGLLSALQERGFNRLTGFDPSPACGRSARQLYGIEVHSDFADVPRNCGVVMAIGVLEHIRDAAKAIQGWKDLLSDNGSLYIEVPDSSEFARWPDAPYQQFSVEHINFFSPQSLNNILAANGFVPEYQHRYAHLIDYGTMFPVVAGLYRPSSTPPAISFDGETEPRLLAYIEQSRAVEAEIEHQIDEIVASDHPVFVWGVGTHTTRLLTTTSLGHANIRGFVDSNPKYQGKSLSGRPILPPSALASDSAPILISSRVFQENICAQIRETMKLPNRLIRLYNLPLQPA